MPSLAVERISIVTHNLIDEGIYPNNAMVPLVIYRSVFDQTQCDAESFEHLFQRNEWSAAWRSSIFDYHHYHSTSHEVLGVFRGQAKLQFGGDNGPIEHCELGDVVVIPAGVAHRQVESGNSFSCVGAYPLGACWDVLTGAADDRPAADRRINAVPLPRLDPVFGNLGGSFKVE